MYLYLALLTVTSLLVTPILLYKIIKKPDEWKQRIGFLNYPQTSKKKIWFHAASVGEFNALVPLLREFIALYNKEYFIFISTMTATGNERAKKFADEYPKSIFPYILPLDVPLFIKKCVRYISPEILIITETEIWPALLHYTHKSGARIALINGRISEKSRKEFKKLPCIFRKAIGYIDRIGVQTEEDKKRFLDLTHKEVELTGNMKFGLELPEYDTREIKRNWHLTSDFIITFGSSRPGEEELVAKLYHELKEKNIEFQIIIAPRHLQRMLEIEKTFQNAAIEYEKLSSQKRSSTLLILDTIGELTKAYAVCDLALIGGSFYDFTGHNPLEAAYFSKPIIIGPFYQSCKDTVDTLQKSKAIFITPREKLCSTVLSLYENKELCKTTGDRAKVVMEQNSDVIRKNLHIIQELL